MSWLSKAIKRNKRHIGKLVQKGASIASGGLSDRAISLAKSGAKLVKGAKASRTLDRIPRPQLDAIALKSRVPSASSSIDNTAVAMPGGARIGAAPKRRRAKAPRGAVVARPKSKAPKAKKAPKVKSKRKAPTGGLDLKALSASWKSAGKPGTWQGWIKASRAA